MGRSYNQIIKLEDNNKKEKKNSKMIFLVLIGILVFILILFIIFKDSIKLNSLDTFEESTKIIEEKTFDDDFNELKINSDFANIYIDISDNSKTETVIYGENANAKIQNDQGTLNIKSKLTCLVCHGTLNGKIYIKVPEEKLEKIVIDSKYGDVVLSSFSKSKLDINMKYGNVLIEDINKLDMKLESGNVKISDVDDVTSDIEIGNVTVENIYNFADIKTGLGNIIINNVNIKKDSNLYTKNGSVNILYGGEIYYNAKSNNGIVNVPEENESYKSGVNINITTDVGNINVGK